VTPLCVDIASAAASVGVSTGVLRSYIDRGLLPIVKFPSAKHEGEKSRRVLIAVADLEAFVAKCRVTEPEAER
jgi:hypothetical protein